MHFEAHAGLGWTIGTLAGAGERRLRNWCVAAAVAPDLNELGWKETVRMNPGEVTRVLMKFDLPAVPFMVPASPRIQNGYGITGQEFVWHCHILEHEEHDMMRPLIII